MALCDSVQLCAALCSSVRRCVDMCIPVYWAVCGDERIKADSKQCDRMTVSGRRIRRDAAVGRSGLFAEYGHERITVMQ